MLSVSDAFSCTSDTSPGGKKKMLSKITSVFFKMAALAAKDVDKLCLSSRDSKVKAET